MSVLKTFLLAPEKCQLWIEAEEELMFLFQPCSSDVSRAVPAIAAISAFIEARKMRKL